MKKFTLILLFAIPSIVSAQKTGLAKFFSPIGRINKTDSAQALIVKPFDLSPVTIPSITNPQTLNAWRPVVVVPALKIVQSSTPNTQVDALLLTSMGGGISYEHLTSTDGTNWTSTFSFSPLTVLVNGNLTANTPINLSYAVTVGAFNNLLMLGGGYDLGTVTGRSRIFGLLSIGINFNNGASK